MTDGLDQAIVSAGIALLQADTNLTVYAAEPPAGTVPPYVRVYAVVARPKEGAANTLDGRSRTFVARWYCHCIGGNDSAARAVAQRVRTALLDVRPTVTGLSTGLIYQEGSDTPPTKDTSTGVVVMDVVQTYALVAS